MTDHGFDRTDGALILYPAGFSPQFLQTVKFRQISPRCSGTMTLDQLDVMGGPTAGIIDFAHGAQLAFAVRGKQGAPHVVGKADAVNQTVN